MKINNLFTLIFIMLLPLISHSQKWVYDKDQAQSIKSVLVNHEEQYVFGGNFEFNENGKDIIMENLAVFFSMNAYSQKAYLNRALTQWNDQFNISPKESEKFQDLIDAWSSMLDGIGGDQEVLDALNNLVDHATTPIVQDLLIESGADQLTPEIPDDPFEINQTATIMAGLWGGIIASALVSAIGSALESISPAVLAKGVREVMNYAVDGAVKVGSYIGQGISIGAQWVGYTLKKLFGNSGGKNGGGKKGGNKKSVVPIPGGQGDCCGLPYPMF